MSIELQTDLASRSRKAIALNATAIVLWILICLASAAQASVSDLATILTNDDAVGRLRQLPPYINSLSPEAIPAALKQAIAGHGPGRENAIDALSGRWVDLDAPAALAFARQTTDREAKSSISDTYYGAWAVRDPDVALAAAKQASEEERAEAAWLVAHKIGAQDPRRANELLGTIHSVNMQDNDYFLYWHWAEKDLAQATQTLLQKAQTANFSYPCEEAVWAMTDRLLDRDPQAAIQWLTQLPPGKVHDEAFDRLVSEWTKVDRDAVATWLKSLPESQPVRNKISNLPPNAAKNALPRVTVDPAFAAKAVELDKILGESNFWDELEALLPWVDGLTAAEFPQALAQLSNAQDSNRDTVIDVLVARWAEVDPAGAIKAIGWAGRIHDSEFCDKFLGDVYAPWAQRDPEAALAAATRDDHNVGNFRVLWVIFPALVKQDPAKAYATFRKLNDANSHMIIVPLFTEWAVRDLAAATKAMSTDPNCPGAIEGIVIGLMRSGPPVAIKWATHLPVKSQSDHALQDVALRWPDDPAAAESWLEKSPAFDGKDSAFEDVAVDWAIRDPQEALHYAVALPAGKEKDCLLNWGLSQWTYDDAPAAENFARHLPDDEMKKHALATVLASWEEYDPVAAAASLASMAGDATPNDIAGVAESMSARDPAAAVHWLDSLPATADKAPAIAKIAQNWYRRDASAALSWVNQMSTEKRYDAGARGICEALNGDLSPALKWARTIHDAKLRHTEIYHAFEAATYEHMRFGFLSDSSTMKDQIQGTAELTDAEKKTLIARLPVLVFNPVPQPVKKAQ